MTYTKEKFKDGCNAKDCDVGVKSVNYFGIVFFVLNRLLVMMFMTFFSFSIS